MNQSLIEEDKITVQPEDTDFSAPSISFDKAVNITQLLEQEKIKDKAWGDWLYVFRIEAAGQVWRITKKFRDFLRLTSAVNRN